MLRFIALLTLAVVAFGTGDGIHERWSKGYKGTISNADCGGEFNEEEPACSPSCTIDLKFPVELENLNSGMAFPTQILNNDRTTWRMVARPTECVEGETTIFKFTADFREDFRNELYGDGYYLTIEAPTLI
ncbi:unnamed protein product [Owenia fusiformis]|uniref:Uncharacterized protein n=1 Tax=Owenia fusiformis TaxID=6347 RepID=A0A8J1XU69_OWEFU|nr:unnamed protein product [Owenia fusiformis]